MTLQTAVWHRKSGDLSVVHLHFPKGAWIGRLEDANCVFADSAACRKMALAVCACQSVPAIVWVTGGKDLPPSEKQWRANFGLELCEPGGVVVARLRDRVSLKAFREVRPKLAFTPRQWQVPTDAALEERGDWKFTTEFGVGKGRHRADGSWLFVNYDAKAHENLARILWAMHVDRRELMDYQLAYCVDDLFGSSTRLYYSSFRSTYRYAWESDHAMHKRMKGEG